MGSVTKRECGGCRRALPDWWDDPRCPGCPAGQATHPETDPAGAPGEPAASLWGPPTAPPAPPLHGAGRTSGGWVNVVVGLLGRRLAWRLAGTAVGLIIIGIGSVANLMERNEAIASPARDVLQSPCAQFRAFDERRDPQLPADYINWLATHQVTFAEAARLDPDLAGAAVSIGPLHAYYTGRVAGAPRAPREQVDAMRAPLESACRTGPGRA